MCGISINKHFMTIGVTTNSTRKKRITFEKGRSTCRKVNTTYVQVNDFILLSGVSLHETFLSCMMNNILMHYFLFLVARG